MLKSLLVIIAAIASIALFTTRARAAQDLRLQAVMRGTTGAKAVASYEERPRGNLVEQRFKVQIEGVPKGSQHLVSVNGEPIATITANQFGRGRIDLRVNGDDPGTSVPSLPHIQAGNTVTVGTLTGTFVQN